MTRTARGSRRALVPRKCTSWLRSKMETTILFEAPQNRLQPSSFVSGLASLQDRLYEIIAKKTLGSTRCLQGRCTNHTANQTAPHDVQETMQNSEKTIAVPTPMLIKCWVDRASSEALRLSGHRKQGFCQIPSEKHQMALRGW